MNPINNNTENFSVIPNLTKESSSSLENSADRKTVIKESKKAEKNEYSKPSVPVTGINERITEKTNTTIKEIKNLTEKISSKNDIYSPIQYPE